MWHENIRVVSRGIMQVDTRADVAESNFSQGQDENVERAHMARRMTAKPRLIRRKSRRRESDGPFVAASAPLELWLSIAAKKAAGTVRARTLPLCLSSACNIKPGRWHGPNSEKSEI